MSLILVTEIINSVFSSKTYIITSNHGRMAWLVDIGDFEPVLAFLRERGLDVGGVFITHGHFDHIYGLISLIEHYPECKVYVTEYGKESLASDKLNMSKYHDSPITYNGGNVVVVHDGESLPLFEGESEMQLYETPGHNPGCLTMVLDDMIFTGDAYIPGIDVNLQMPHANKEQANQSLNRILKLAEKRRVLPGHKI